MRVLAFRKRLPLNGYERSEFMQKEKKSSSIRLLLQWAGKEKYWMYLAVILSFFSGICTMIPYYGIYSLMSAVYTGTCTTEFVIRDAGIIAGGIVIRFLLFGASGVASHKGAYRALLKVRCMVIDHMAKVPLGALNERSTGEIKTVLNEDIEKLELFLAHNVPELICYLIGPVVVFIYLLTVMYLWHWYRWCLWYWRYSSCAGCLWEHPA